MSWLSYYIRTLHPVVHGQSYLACGACGLTGSISDPSNAHKLGAEYTSLSRSPFCSPQYFRHVEIKSADFVLSLSLSGLNSLRGEEQYRHLRCPQKCSSHASSISSPHVSHLLKRHVFNLLFHVQSPMPVSVRAQLPEKPSKPHLPRHDWCTLLWWYGEAGKGTGGAFSPRLDVPTGGCVRGRKGGWCTRHGKIACLARTVCVSVMMPNSCSFIFCCTTL